MIILYKNYYDQTQIIGLQGIIEYHGIRPSHVSVKLDIVLRQSCKLDIVMRQFCKLDIVMRQASKIDIMLR